MPSTPAEATTPHERRSRRRWSKPRWSRRDLLAGVAGALSGLAGCGGRRGELQAPDALGVAETDWTHPDGGPGRARATAAEALPGSPSLRETWAVRFPDARNVGVPVVRDGLVYLPVYGHGPDSEETAGPAPTILAAYDVDARERTWLFRPVGASSRGDTGGNAPGTGEEMTRGTVTGVAVAGETVFVTTSFSTGPSARGGRLYALAAGSGAVRWRRATWVAPRPTVDPAGRVYLTEWSDSLVRNGADGGLAARVRSERVRLRAFDAGSGQELWEYPGKSPLGRLLGPPGVRASELSYYAPTLADGGLRWVLSPERDDDSFDTDADPAVHHIDPATGRRRSVHTPGLTVDEPPAAGDGAWYSMSLDWPDDDGGVVFGVHDGDPRWDAPVSHWAARLAVSAEAGVVCALAGDLQAFDAATGEVRWRDEHPTDPPSVAGERVVYATYHPADEGEDGFGENFLVVRDARSGDVERRRPLPSGAQRAIPAGGRLVVTTGRNDESVPSLHVFE